MGRRSTRRASTAVAALIALMWTAGCASTQPAQAATPAGADDGTITLNSRVVSLDSGVSLAVVKKAQKEILELGTQSSAPIWLIINSPGGSVDAGLILVDTIAAIDSPVHCVVESKAYSMAAILLVFCDRAYGYPHATFMLHEASYGTAGDDPSNRSKLEFLTTYLDRLHADIAARLGLEVGDYRERIRDAWWLLTDEALEVGLIDAIVRDVRYVTLPVEQTEDKRVVTYPYDPNERPFDPPEIPKRRD